jgi:plastocyanin
MHRSTLRLAGGLLILGALGAALACGYSSPSAPDTSTPGMEGASITITAAGLSPSAVTITSGQSVTFVNQDTVAHNISSTPVPTYDDCPGINRVAQVAPGQSVQTGALTVARACNFIDLSRMGDPRWQGTITVQ